jgi:hypothetical protein
MVPVPSQSRTYVAAVAVAGTFRDAILTKAAQTATVIHSEAEYACERKNPAARLPASAMRNARA